MKSSAHKSDPVRRRVSIRRPIAQNTDNQQQGQNGNLDQNQIHNMNIQHIGLAGSNYYYNANGSINIGDNSESHENVVRRRLQTFRDHTAKHLMEIEKKLNEESQQAQIQLKKQQKQQQTKDKLKVQAESNDKPVDSVAKPSSTVQDPNVTVSNTDRGKEWAITLGNINETNGHNDNNTAGSVEQNQLSDNLLATPIKEAKPGSDPNSAILNNVDSAPASVTKQDSAPLLVDTQTTNQNVNTTQTVVARSVSKTSVKSQDSIRSRYSRKTSISSQNSSGKAMVAATKIDDPTLKQFSALNGKTFADVVPPDIKSLRLASSREIIHKIDRNLMESGMMMMMSPKNNNDIRQSQLQQQAQQDSDSGSQGGGCEGSVEEGRGQNVTGNSSDDVKGGNTNKQEQPAAANAGESQANTVNNNLDNPGPDSNQSGPPQQQPSSYQQVYQQQYQPPWRATDLIFGHTEGLPKVNLEDDSTQDWFRKTAGMHTVQRWCENYHKHPYGWGALIMIHGTDEVCFRLRTKVENYAVYSALFLSASIVLILAPSDTIALLCQTKEKRAKSLQPIRQLLSIDSNSESDSVSAPSDSYDPDIFCQIQKRFYFYSILMAIFAHVTSILLAMAFINAFNEAARDSDIIRMFAEGKGYLATVKCERGFQVGLVMLLVGLVTGISIYMTILDSLFAIFLVFLLYKSGYYQESAKLLFEASSIMHYWRWGRGHGGGTDPYQLDIPIERLQNKCDVSRLLQASMTDESEGLVPK